MQSNGKLPYVCLYLDNLESFRELPLHSVGRLVVAMLNYMETEEEPQLKGVERVLWPGLRAKMLRDQRAYSDRCEKNRINGAKGGKQKQQNRAAALLEESEDSSCYQSQANLANKNKNKNKNKNENKNESENENENEKKENKDKCHAAAPPRPQFHKPSVEDIQAYCQGKGYAIDPEAVWDYYEANGWRVGQNPMKDWKAAVRNWMRKENHHGRTQKPALTETLIFKNSL